MARRVGGTLTPMAEPQTFTVESLGLATLDEQGMTPESVPGRGARINLRKNANLSTGGTATDVTDDVHPDLAASAVAAAHMVGLDICGVDVVCDSVYKPLQEQGGGIVEVNAAPGLRMHLSPSYGKGRPVGEAIVRQMFAPGDNGRIPVVAVSGTNGKTTTIRLTAHLINKTGKRIGHNLFFCRYQIYSYKNLCVEIVRKEWS